MCGGGETGGANNKDNDDKKGSGNSFKESLANVFTPNDGFSYKDGVLTATNDKGSYTPVDSSNPNEASKSVTVSDNKGGTFQVPTNETKSYNDGLVMSAVMGAMTGGLPGIIGGVAGNALRGGIKSNAKDSGSKSGSGIKGLFQPGGFFAGPKFDTPEEEAAYQEQQKQKAIQASRSRADGSDNNDSRVKQTVTNPTSGGISDMSDMSIAAAQGAFQPIPNPDYDPNDPMSPKFIINPSYQQLLEYQQSQIPGMAMGGYPKIDTFADFKMRRPAYSEPLQQYGNYLEGEYGDSGFEQKKDSFLEEVNMKERQTFGQGGLGSMFMGQPRPGPHLGDPRGPMNFAELQTNPMQASTFPQNLTRGFAEGGEIEQAPQEGIAAVPQEGGNEKTDIADAVSAVKGDMSKEEASVVLGKFLANYGEEALRDLVEKVKSGEYDDTKERFANGEAGEVNGPGDGSGVDDKVPASLEGQEDVLLADGEYVLRANTADKLTKAFGGGFLDAVNESEDNAPRVIREYAAKTATA